ncbi:MAG: hypothetical protein PHH82_04415 [Candidatus ainarchaeum sp.]|nr:hypothetical protein [Candidatus ainarchaeum sp.]
MNLIKEFNYLGYKIKLNLFVTEAPQKFIFLYLPKNNTIVVMTGNKGDNHTEILHKSVGSKDTEQFVWGGWVKEVNGKIMFFSRSKKYGNNIFGLRIVRIIQKMFYDEPGLKNKLHGLPREKKIDAANIFPHVIERLRRP